MDLLLTRLGVKYLVVEAKRPGSFDGPGSINRALRQAVDYACEVNVATIAVSDGCVPEARDLTLLTICKSAQMSRSAQHSTLNRCTALINL